MSKRNRIKRANQDPFFPRRALILQQHEGYYPFLFPAGPVVNRRHVQILRYVAQQYREAGQIDKAATWEVATPDLVHGQRWDGAMIYRDRWDPAKRRFVADNRRRGRSRKVTLAAKANQESIHTKTDEHRTKNRTGWFSRLFRRGDAREKGAQTADQGRRAA